MATNLYLENLVSNPFHISALDVPPDMEIPGYLGTGDNDDKEIVQFYRRIRYYILDYARIFVEGYRLDKVDEGERENITVNSGFASLAILNAMFDLQGLLIGDDNYFTSRNIQIKKPTKKTFMNWESSKYSKDQPDAWFRVYIGLHYFLDDCLHTDEKNYEVYYKGIRNGIAHVVFPNQIYLHSNEVQNNDLEKPLTITEYPKSPKQNTKTVLAIHRILFYKRIRERFDEYVKCIRNPQTQDDSDLRKRFLERIKHV